MKFVNYSVLHVTTKPEVKVQQGIKLKNLDVCVRL